MYFRDNKNQTWTYFTINPTKDWAETKQISEHRLGPPSLPPALPPSPHPPSLLWAEMYIFLIPFSNTLTSVPGRASEKLSISSACSNLQENPWLQATSHRITHYRTHNSRTEWNVGTSVSPQTVFTSDNGALCSSSRGISAAASFVLFLQNEHLDETVIYLQCKHSCSKAVFYQTGHVYLYDKQWNVKYEQYEHR